MVHKINNVIVGPCDGPPKLPWYLTYWALFIFGVTLALIYSTICSIFFPLFLPTIYYKIVAGILAFIMGLVIGIKRRKKEQYLKGEEIMKTKGAQYGQA